jgi:hypothetical protein
MRRTMIPALACAALSTLISGAYAGEKNDDPQKQTSDRVQVTKFLKEHVMGRAVATPKVTFKLDDSTMEGDYEELTTFNNFAETEHGFGFDVTTVSKETRFDLDKAGKRIQPGRDNSGTEVFRYEICERASTGKLTGTSRLRSKTTKGPGYEGCAILVAGIKLADGKLTWNETLPGYVDLIATRGRYKPGSWDSKYTFSVVEGKLRTEYETKRFDVDPDTLKRTPSDDKIPLFVGKETDRK